MPEQMSPTPRLAGPLLILGSALAFSTAGLFTRGLATDVWTLLFWRGVFGGAFIGGFICWQHRGATVAAFRVIGRVGLLAGACSTVATICFINALRQSTVADVTIIYATAPFVAAAMAWLWMRQREGTITLAASLLALVGVVIMFDAAVSVGHVAGNLLALAMTVLMAGMMVIVRRQHGVSMLPASCLSAFGCAAVVWPVAHPLAVSGGEFGLLALFGVTQFGLGLLLLTLGGRLISATRASLLANLELPVAPFWVWLAFGEMPSLLTWVGGAIVMLAIVLEMVATHWRERPERVAAA
jgi:drug/metabolite transporter (DMT)-like permease